MAEWIGCEVCKFNIENECHRLAPRPIVMFEGHKGEQYERVSDEDSATELDLRPLTVWPLALGGCGEGKLTKEAEAPTTKTV